MTIAIGGMIKTTLVDFPARVACAIFLQGCNFRCGFCHNPALVPPGAPADPVEPEAVIDLLLRRRGLVDGLAVSGGEPLMQPGLGAFLRRVKSETGVAVKLDTNGAYPGRLERMLTEGLVDLVAMDIKAPPDLYNRATGGKGDHRTVAESLAVLRRSGTPFELRTTLVPGLAGAEQLSAICRWVGDPATAYVLQPFRPDVTLDPEAALLAPFGSEEMERLAEQCRPYFGKVTVRRA